jgi:hypothetical protein
MATAPPQTNPSHQCPLTVLKKNVVKAMISTNNSFPYCFFIKKWLTIFKMACSKCVLPFGTWNIWNIWNAVEQIGTGFSIAGTVLVLLSSLLSIHYSLLK